jgi:hypothetical protein
LNSWLVSWLGWLLGCDGLMARKGTPPSKASVKAAADRASGLPPDDPADKGGRPTSYDPSFADQAKKLCELGATDIEIADFFEVSDRTIYRWQLKYPEFCQALKAGKDVADDRVERSLYHKATGYTFESEKIFQYEGAIVRAKTREHVPPDTVSMIFWLKNRRPEQWREKTEQLVRHEHINQLSDDELARIATSGSEGNSAKKGGSSKLN